MRMRRRLPVRKMPAFYLCLALLLIIVSMVGKFFHGPYVVPDSTGGSTMTPGFQAFRPVQSRHPAKQPRLGAQVSAFTARYGEPEIRGRGAEYGYLPCSSGDRDLTPNQVTIGDIVGPYDDGVKGVNWVEGEVCPPGETTLPADWRATAQLFLPIDAVKKNRIFDQDDGVYEQLYYSPSVARATPHYDQPLDCNDDPVPPGTLYVVGSNELGKWTVGIGGGYGVCF